MMEQRLAAHLPMGLFVIDVKKSDGTVENWAVEAGPPGTLASTPGFAERVMQLLQRVDYRRAVSPDDREAIFRLRHDA